MLTFPVPAALHGDALTDELAAAGFDAEVAVRGDELIVSGPGDAARGSVQAVVDAHVPPAPEPNPDDEFRAAVEAASDIAGLKAALLGTSGPGAQPRNRPTA